MLRQDCDAIEYPLRGRVGLRKVKLDGRRIQFLDRDRLTTDDQEIPLRRMHFFIEMQAKREDNIVGTEGVTVGKTQTSSKHECVRESVARDLPTLRQGWRGQLRDCIDVQQVRRHPSDDVAGGLIDGI